MSHYLHRLSAILFYALGISFLLAYLLHYNNVTHWAYAWLVIGDLPLALAAILYGGTSFYLSVKQTEGESKGLALGITLPLLVLFILLMVLNFWKTA